MEPEGNLLSRKQAAEYLRRRNCSISYQTLGNLAANGNANKGPPFYKDGQRTLYSPEDLDAWRLARRTRVE
jgi:hypothetical protein